MNLSQIEDYTTSLFKIIYQQSNVWNGSTRWMGFPICKPPTDLWTIQEIIFDTAPTLIIETGTWYGGNALYMAIISDCMEVYGLDGKIISIDIENPYDEKSTTSLRPRHHRIEYLFGSSIDNEIVEKVKSKIRPEDKVMVMLDSDHSKSHVIEELKIYSKLVTPKMYLIVDDTNLNGNPVVVMDDKFVIQGEGPNEALQEFMETNNDFEVDKSREKFLLTFNPGGFLRKKDDI